MANLLKKIKAGLLKLPLFAFNNKRKHKSYVFKGNKENFYSLIITHSEHSGKRKNLRLNKNVDINDKKPSYIDRKIYKDNYRNFGRVYSNLKFDKNDKSLVRKLKKNKKR